MRFRDLSLPGALLIEPDPQADERGMFGRLFDAGTFRDRGLPTEFVQASFSFNRRAGTLRGLHYQAEPFAEEKLVRCTAGRLFDVIVDVRPASPTFGRWQSVELSAENRLTLYIPRGFAHGFETLADATEVFYQMTRTHAPEAERGIAWNDARMAIAWPQPPAVISERDRGLPGFESVARA